MEKQGSNCPSIFQGLVRYLTLPYNRESMWQQEKGRRCNQQLCGWQTLLLLLLVLVCRFCHTGCSLVPTFEEVEEKWQFGTSQTIPKDVKGVHDGVVEMLGEEGVKGVEKYCTVDYMNKRLELLEEAKKDNIPLRITPSLLVFKHRLREDYMATLSIEYPHKIPVEELVHACARILRGLWVVYSHHHTSFISSVCPKPSATILDLGKEFLVPRGIQFSFHIRKEPPTN